MLSSLTIQNYALIDELVIEPGTGLTILTGETGAGKSIIIDALGLLLGERANPSVVRAGATKAVVEGVFSVRGHRKVVQLLREQGLDPAEELIIRREVSTKAQGRSFVNDTPVPLTVLNAIGDLLVDLHGQHEHQSLLRPSTHVEFLDAFGAIGSDRDLYQETLETLRSRVRKYHEVRAEAAEMQQREELYRFQLHEIDEVRPDPDEEEQLIAEIRTLDNAEKIYSNAQELLALLYEGDRSVFDLFSVVHEKLQLLSALDPRFNEGVAESESAKAVVEELSRFLRDYTSRMDFSPERVEEVRERLGRITMLKKKFGGSIESVLEYREKIAEAVRMSSDVDAIVERLKGEIEELSAKCASLAARLSAKRTAAARKLEPDIVRSLRTLGMPNVVFSVELTQNDPGDDIAGEPDGEHVQWKDKRYRLTEDGFDKVEFLISANVGEPARSLSRIASGGEISRIMLALKGILARRDRLPVVVFDEIDAGVSGRVAQAVGQSLKKLSETIQVIVITHLPQIAGLADVHFAVSKTDDGNRTRTVVRKLGDDERVREVARLLSGEQITETGLKGARELMKNH